VNNIGTQRTQGNAILNLGTAQIQNGTAITYNGSNGIALNPNQIYEASYSGFAEVSGTPGTSSAISVGFQGVAGSGLNVAISPGPVNRQFFSNTILVDSNVNPNLFLFGGTTLQGGMATFTNVQVSVIKVQ
jgi:hypothetical protein